MSSSILFEISKLTGYPGRPRMRDPHSSDELLTVFGYGHLTELYPEKKEYFESLCQHLNTLAVLAHECHEQNMSRRIESTLQRVCKIESRRLLDAA